jgi:deoxyribose-phosphate aldolase
MQISLFKSKKYKETEKDIEEISNIVHPKGSLKVIIEAPILSYEEILLAARITESAGSDFVKSGTGTNGVVRVSQIKQIKRATRLPIKAAGGIKNIESALQIIEAGATIIGSSSSVEIIKGLAL